MRTRNIAIFIRLNVAWDREVAKGIAEYARKRPRWRLFVSPGMPQPGALASFFLPAEWKCHGAIALSWVAPSIAAGVPLVRVSKYKKQFGVVVVNPDNIAIGRMAAEHLHQIGFRRMTMYGVANKPWAVERGEGFRRAVEALGAQVVQCPLLHTYSDDADFYDLASALGRWLRTVQPPLGIMAANDNAARTVSEACRLGGFRVPEQVAIIGVDNDLFNCELSGVPLSSIDPAADRIGVVAAEALDHWMTNRRRPTSKPILVPPKYVVQRQSTDVLAIKDEDVTNALRFLHDHACDPLGVNDVADAVCLSRRTLERRFKKHVGHSIVDEITRLRLQQACEKLRSSNKRVKEIAVASGFPNLIYFHHIFKRETGLTPAGYRKWIRGGN